MDNATPRFDVQPSASNHFAWLNTQMSLERTLMAGLRTGVSLIGFGFTVAQFFERIQDETAVLQKLRPQAPRNLGLTLIAAGVALVGLFLWQYRRTNAYLWSDLFKPVAGIPKGPLHSGPYYAAWVVLAIGLAAFVSVFLRF